jgi:hypothetical protein
MAEYNQCAAAGNVREWRADMAGKADQGHVVIGRLKGMFRLIPKDPWVVRDLWCQALELFEQIQAGLACLQAHLDYELEFND